MNTIQSDSLFIFDANFFIALKEIRAKRPYHHLKLARDELNLKFYVSAQVFNELPFLVGTTYQNFTKAIKIEMVKDEQIIHVKNDLQNKGVRLLAQDPDLSLIALGHQLKSKINTVFVVTDDFKLNQNIENTEYRIQCLPLPSFLQIIASNLKNKKKSYWKWIRSRILQYNLDYMISRANIYKPQAKITWLIENAVSIAGEGIHFSQTGIEEQKDIQEKLNQEREFLLICEQYFQGKKLSSNQKKQIAEYEDALEEIRQTRKLIKKGKQLLMEGEYRKTLLYLRSANELLNHHFQLMGAKLQINPEKYNFFERIMGSEISKVLFLRAYVLIENGKMAIALSTLDQTALFATMAQFPETVLTINYLKGILYIFESKYEKAVKQFQFNYDLASVLQVDPNLAETLRIKAIIGGAITNFLIGKANLAFQQINDANLDNSTQTIVNLMQALVDSGDYFLALGFPEIASNLYSEALECAVDTVQEWKFSFLLSKLKKAYMASSLISTDTRTSGDISALIDKFHDIEDIQSYNDLMTQLALFTNKLYQPFPHFSAGKRKLINYHELPEELRYEWDCVKIQPTPGKKQIYLIGFKEEVGLVAFDVKMDPDFEGAPENYELKLKASAKIRIDPPDRERENMFLIRAVIKIGNLKRDLEINRKPPVFFKQLQL